MAINELYEFGPFLLDPARRRLTRDGELVPLTSKAFETLLVLVRNHDRVMAKDELMQAVWPDSFVEEVNLAQNISALRKLFGEAPGENRFIATIPGKGYRFVSEVRPASSPMEKVLPPPRADEDRAVSENAGEILIERQVTTKVVVEEQVQEDNPQSDPTPPFLTAYRPTFLGLDMRAWTGVAVLLLVVTAALFWRRSAASQAAAPHSLAVLPFQALTSADDQYLGVGMTDAVITRLSNVKQLAVRPTSLVLRYGGTDPLQAGRELGVDSVLDGKVQRAGDRIRVTVQMIDVKSGRPLWAETFDENFTNVFTFEDSISQKVTAVLPLQLAGGEREQLARNYTANAEAYQAYIKGRYEEFRFTPEGMKNAIAYFNKAIALDPSYALAYAGLADAYTTASEGSLAPREALPKAEAAARQAIALDINLAEGHAALAHSLFHQWKMRDAGTEFQRALSLNPNNTAFYFTYSEYLGGLGRFDDAIAQTHRALELDPLSPESYMILAWARYLKRDYDGVLAASQKALQIEPDFMPAQWLVGGAHLAKGESAQAVEGFRKAAAMSNNDPIALSGLATAYAAAGQRADAAALIPQLEALRAKQYVAALNIGLAYAAIGDRDQAFAWFDKAFDERSEFLMMLDYDPRFDSVRSDPRFTLLAKKVHEQIN